MPLDSTTPDKVILPPKAEAKPTVKSGVRTSLGRLGRRKWLLGGAAVLLAVAAWFALGGAGGKKDEIVSAPVTRGNLEQTVLASGVLEPARLVSVGAQVSGQVKKLYVELGDTVKQGDPIAEIDSRTQSNTVSNAQAGLSNVTAQRAAAAASLTEAQLSYDRTKRLYEAGAASKADYDAAQSRLANAQASLKAAEAQIKQANLTLNTAETNLGYAKIVAPMDGTIVAVVTKEGQTVNANQSAPTIVKLAKLDTMTVSAEISEADVEKVTAGQTVYFTTLGDTRTRHYASLRAVAPAPSSIESDSASSSSSATAVYYNGLFDVENADGKLKTGMTAQVYVVLAEAKNALIIPSAALEGRGRDGVYTVKVVAADDKATPREVKIGINTNASAQVLSGLKEGEQVVIAQASAATKSASSARNPMTMSTGGGRRGGGGGPP